MNVYLITYDLNSPGQKYDCLYEAIKKSFPTYWNCMNNIFIIQTSYSAIQIRDYLDKCIDGNDKLLVASLGKEVAWQGLNKNCSDWFEKVLS